jgi:hypothetical protein
MAVTVPITAAAAGAAAVRRAAAACITAAVTGAATVRRAAARRGTAAVAVAVAAVVVTMATQPITAACLGSVGRQQDRSNSKQTQDQQFPIHALLLGRARVPDDFHPGSEQADEEETPDANHPLPIPWTNHGLPGGCTSNFFSDGGLCKMQRSVKLA